MTEQMKVIRDFMKNYSGSIPDEINGDMQLIADLGFNSLTLLELLNDAEKSFKVVFDDCELNRIVTVGDIISILKKKKAVF